MHESSVELTKLDFLVMDLFLYLNPDVLKDKIEINPKINKKKIEEYSTLLDNIRSTYNIIQKYESYFTEFYPDSEKITKQEALEHHIHAYLEDMTIFKNKIEAFLGVLKNDLKKFAINKNEITKALNFLINKVDKGFNGISRIRTPHHHKGYRFIDKDLSDSQSTNIILQIIQNNLSLLKLKPSFLLELERKEIDSFKKAKSAWISQAKSSNKDTKIIIEEIFERISDFVYQFLEVKPISENYYLSTKRQ